MYVGRMLIAPDIRPSKLLFLTLQAELVWIGTLMKASLKVCIDCTYTLK